MAVDKMLKIMIFFVGFIMTASLNAEEIFNYKVSLGISDGKRILNQSL